MAYPTRSITGLPPNLFSGGAVGFNPTPIVDYVNNVQAKNQAKQDAFSKFYDDLGKSLTPTGMHSDDIPDVISKKNDWQNYAMQNRKYLMNPSLDNGAAYAESNRRFNDAMQTARLSQAKVANLGTIKTLTDDPKRMALMTESSLHAMHRASLPIKDPDYKPIDPNDIQFNPKPFDLNDQAKVSTMLKAIKPEQAPGTPMQDKTTGMQTTSFTPKYDKDQTKAMYQLGSNLYANHPGFKADVDKHANIGDADYDKLNEVYKQHFKPEDGYNANITTAEDMAAAKVISLNPNGTINPKVQPIPAESALGQQNKRDMAAYTAGLHLKNSEAFADHNFNNKLQVAQQKGDVSGFADDRINEALQKPSQPIIHPDGTKTEMHPMEASGAILNLFPRKGTSDNNKSITTYPNSLRVSPDGKTIYPVYTTSGMQPNGKVGVNEEITKGFSKDEFKAVLQKAKIGVSPGTTTTTRESSRSTKLTKGAFDHL